MEKLLHEIQTIQNRIIETLGLTGSEIIIVGIIIILTLVFRQVFIAIVVNRIEAMTKNTDTEMDDRLIGILKQPLGWLVFLAGLWVVQQVLGNELSEQVNNKITEILGLLAIFIVSYIIYTASPLLGEVLKNLTLKTETELDDLLVPYLPKIFQVAAIVLVLIKSAEVLLGTSANAIVGLLGGAGVALGLLLKDLIYDWCCAIIIYIDDLYKPGDTIMISGISGFIKVEEIGLRTTKLFIANTAAIIKMPNSKMIDGIVENWAQNRGKEIEWGILLTLKIDGISAEKTAIVCEKIKEKIKSLKAVSDIFMLRFSGIEGNARVLKIRTYVNDSSLYFETEKELNLAILDILATEGVKNLNVLLRTEPESYQQAMQAIDMN